LGVQRQAIENKNDLSFRKPVRKPDFLTFSHRQQGGPDNRKSGSEPGIMKTALDYCSIL
jgi:hypothetical protein